MSDIDITYGGEYPDRPDNVFRAWNGEYYTEGTAPEKPPEPEPEETKEENKSKATTKEGSKAGATPAKPATPATPAPAAKPEG
jgi:hypothetical protein